MAADPETQGHRAWELKTFPFLPKQLLADPILSSEAICLEGRKAYDSRGPTSCQQGRELNLTPLAAPFQKCCWAGYSIAGSAQPKKQ